MTLEITERTPLRHNPLNGVTAAIERVTRAQAGGPREPASCTAYRSQSVPSVSA
jgi:hypothetical protein